MTDCARCDGLLKSANQYFCEVCLVNMIPTIYPCRICKKDFSASSVVKFCNDCIPIDFAVDLEELRKV